MFERFTDRARRVVVIAQEEARKLSHNYIGSEHLLLGIFEGQAENAEVGVGGRVLRDLGLRPDVLRALIPPGRAPVSGHIPFTAESKKLLEGALREALKLGHKYIGPEHLLLALVWDLDNEAVGLLREVGVDRDDVRKAVLEKLDAYKKAEEAAVPTEIEQVVTWLEDLDQRGLWFISARAMLRAIEHGDWKK